MAIIARCDLETAKSLKSKGISTKVNNRNHKVYLVTDCDDSNITDAVNSLKVSNAVVGIEYIGSTMSDAYLGLTSDVVGSLYIYKTENFGSDISVEDVERMYSEVPTGVVPVAVLPSDFTDLKTLVEITEKFPRVRFAGGDLFEVYNLKLGCYGRDILEKKGIKLGADSLETFDGGNALETFTYIDLTCDITDKPEKTTRISSGSKPSNGGTVSSGKKKQILFSSLLNSGVKSDL